MILEEKIALVTGAGRGLGKTAALALAEEGAKVIVADLNGSAAEETAGEILSIGGDSLAVEVDISGARQVQEMVTRGLKRFGRIDILLASAGIARGPEQWGTDNWKPMEEVAESDWRRIVDINLTGTFLCNQEVGRVMIKQKGGKIINVASISAVVANKGLLGHGAYCASKAGIVALTKVLAAEWARYNINVNCISPAYMNTEMVERVKQRLPKVHELQLDMIPMGRFGEPREFARTIVFLASGDSSYITGHNLMLDGGYTAW